MSANKKEEIKEKKVIPQQIDNKGWLFAQLQSGTISKWGKNGITDDDFIKIALKKLQGKQKSKPCKALSCAITNIEVALMWLEKTEGVL